MNMVLAIIEQAALFLPLMLGAYLSIALMKVPDLSLESAFTFGAILSAKCMPLVQGLPQVFAIPCVVLAAFVGGALVGCTSSFLTQRMGFAHLLSSIVTIGIFYGVNQMVLGTSNLSISGYNNPLALSYMTYFPELPIFLLISALLFILLMALLKTPLGYCFALYGENPYFFKNHKISTSFVFSTCIIMSNGLVGIAGYFFAQANGFVDVTMGLGIPLLAILGLLLGKFVLSKKRLAITVVGILFYFVIQQFLLKLGFNLKFFPMIQGCLILLILAVGPRSEQGKFNHLGV